MYRCTAVSKNGTRCANCIVHVKKDQVIKVGKFWYISCHTHKATFEPFKDFLGKSRRKEVLDSKSRVRVDPVTCFASNTKGEDAYYDMTVCDNRVQQRCLQRNKLHVPDVPEILLSEKYAIQSFVTNKIATHENYARMAVDVLAHIQSMLEKYFPDTLFILKGSAAMRLMLDKAMDHPTLFGDETKRVFHEYVQSSDLDSMVIIDPSGLNRTEYQHKAQAVVESVFSTVLNFIKKMDQVYQRYIQQMLSDLPNSTEELDRLTFQPTKRKSIHIQDDKTTDTVTVRMFFQEGSRIREKSPKKGSYQLPTPKNYAELSSETDEVFFAPDYTPLKITRIHKKEGLLEFSGLIPLNSFEVAIEIPIDDDGEVHITGFLTEFLGHSKNIQVEIPKDFVGGVRDYLIPTAVLLLAGERVKITKIHRKKIQDNITFEVNRKIFPRVIGGARRRVKTQKHWMYTSNHRSIQLEETGSDFALVRAMFPVLVKKGKHRALSKVELVDVSVPNYDDNEMHKNWVTYFSPERRDKWLSFICHRGLRKRAICMKAVNLSYQINDLKRMERENESSVKTNKRKIRFKLIDSVRQYLGLHHKKALAKTKLKKLKGLHLNHAATTLISHVLNDKGFPTLTKEDWNKLKPIAENLQFSAQGLNNILAHLYTLYDLQTKEKNHITSMRLQHLDELYRYFAVTPQ